MNYSNSSLKLDKSHQLQEKASIKWRSPSNIALVKYWGKHGDQLPNNPSISFTLESSFTETEIVYAPRREAKIDKPIQLSFFFEGTKKDAFKHRIEKFLLKILPVFPFLEQLDLEIRSENSFPHSSGIASSASSMSALALCLCSLENRLFKTLENKESFFQKASYIARLGSGSASRSLYSIASMWGASDLKEKSSNLFAIPMAQEMHSVFHSFQNDILIVSSAKKAVSSSAGHQLMEGNIFAQSRYAQANRNLETLLHALRSGDIETVGKITENEALSLHALMMTSNYMLIQPGSVSIMQKIKSFRESTNIPLYFSLDAGPNIHLLYPQRVQKTVRAFIEQELLVFCENRFWLKDRVGKGPIEL